MSLREQRLTHCDLRRGGVKCLMLKFFFLILFCPLLALGEEVRLMTWNVYMLPRIVRNSQQTLRTKLINDFLAWSESDLIFLQEAFIEDFHEAIEKNLKSKYPHILRLEKKSGFILPFLGPGLLAISKYPLKSLGHDYYNDCKGADCFSSKGIHLVEVNLPSGKKIQIANTHMQSGRAEKSQGVRKSQLKQVQELLKKFKVENIPQFLVGDLNVDALEGNEFENTLSLLSMKTVARSEIFKEALEKKDVKQSIKDQFKDFITAGFPAKCIKDEVSPNLKVLDHVLYSDPKASLRFLADQVLNPEFVLGKESCPMSDHKPRAVKFELR